MSSRFGGSPESRWSSERERLEREKQRKEFEQQSPRRSRRSSWREGSASRPAGETPPESTEEPSSPIKERRSADSDATGDDRRPIGRKWRDAVEPEEDSGLPDLPGDDSGGDGRGPSGKGILIFGAILFVLMAVLAFTPIGPLGSDDDGGDEEESTPTLPAAVVPTAAEQDPDGGAVGTPGAQRPSDSELVVCIDPGHGGWDFGRQRQQGDYDQPWFNESEINLAMAFMLREELEARGVSVVMTRETGTAVNVFGEDVNQDGRTILDSEQDGNRDELQARINICNAAGADILVSLHLNGFDTPDVRGYEVLYTANREFGQQNLDLATVIYREIGAAYDDAGFETAARGVKDDQMDLDAEMHEFGSEQHLVLTGPAVNNPDYSIVPSAMPGVFIEPVFITNQGDANFIVLPENQRLLAEAYAEGIMNYFEQHPG